MIRIVAAVLFYTAALDAATIAADSDRGARLFETLSCIHCHRVNGKGGSGGPDLGRSLDRNFTPASLAATMWNHAPAMWTAMSGRNVQPGNLDQQEATDLFAYFYSARFFEKPGDAARGKLLFSAKHCAECHGLTSPKRPDVKPVAQWEAIGNPVALVNAMWNHAAAMGEEFKRRKLAWPGLTSQDLADMLVYLRNLPGTRDVTRGFAITSGTNGQALFTSKGCAHCHTGKLALPPRLKNKTLTDIAVDMWNHAPKMADAPVRIDLEEMREIVSFLWAQQFFESAGTASAGERTFTAKQCATCHNDAASGAPKLSGSFNGASIVVALWHHGPLMLYEMRNKGIAWPRFSAREMSNLIAYLNSRSGAK